VAWQVSWTETALHDLETAADYIARDSPHYAAAFIREALEAGRSLTHFAERGRRVPEFPESNLRELLVGNYRLIYQVTGASVTVLAFIHGARDLWALWLREARQNLIGPS
jgi:plasmid stabilization system protein ParE